MKNKKVGIVIVGMMAGVLITILGIVKFVNPDPGDNKELLFGVIYLLSGLTLVGTNIHRLVVKK
ncbi:MAG: hypothetical protein WDZ94_03125 [Patescibacteria group bacterium]